MARVDEYVLFSLILQLHDIYTINLINLISK